MKRGAVITLAVVTGLAASVAYFFVERSSSMRRAYEAIARANEYYDAGALMWEPRFLEAEKAASEVTGDSLDRASVRACLKYVTFAREALMGADKLARIREEYVRNKWSSQQIANLGEHIRESSDLAEKDESLVRACIAHTVE